MPVEPATVLACSQDRVQLETSRKATCGKCAARQGCGQYLLRPDADVLELETRYLAGSNMSGLRAGDAVTLVMPEGAVARLALVFYCLPLAFLLLATGIASLLTRNEAGLALGGLAGLVVGFLVLPRGLRWLARRGACLPQLYTAGGPGVRPQEFPDES